MMGMLACSALKCLRFILIVLQAVGMSQYIPQLAILLAMDWLIGMFRTITNIWGDACAVSVVDHWANKCA